MRAIHDCPGAAENAPLRIPSALSVSCHNPKRCGDWDRTTPREAVLALLSCLAHDRAVFLVPFLLVLLLMGCRSRTGPSIVFTRVPPAAEGGKDKIDVIQGRVIGSRPEQRIVLYARTGAWWVQPLANEPFTKINADGTWVNSTHVGAEYAAVLVEPGYNPATTVNTLPLAGDVVAAVAVAKAGSALVSKMLSFSGYEWRIRDAPSSRGGGNNYDESNAWTDSKGALHLRIAKRSGDWSCAEVTLTRSLGYGTYSVMVRDIAQLEPAAVFSIFTWDYGGDPNHREMDIEVSRWGDSSNRNAQFVVQPYYVPENATRFTLPAGVLTYSIHWEPGRLTFRTVRGSEAGSTARPVAEHVFTSGVPIPGIESMRMNLYIFRGAKEPLRNENEVVIEKFEYFP
jgi:hypothetical protein